MLGIFVGCVRFSERERERERELETCSGLGTYSYLAVLGDYECRISALSPETKLVLTSLVLPIFSAPMRLKQEDCYKVKAGLGYIVLC